jgi:hypothetical protein
MGISIDPKKIAGTRDFFGQNPDGISILGIQDWTAFYCKSGSGSYI